MCLRSPSLQEAALHWHIGRLCRRRRRMESPLISGGLQAKGMLVEDTDLARAFPTDGPGVLFRKGTSHSVFPLLITAFNLAPEQRSLEVNMLCLGLMPGPRKPGGLGSFLAPMTEEFKLLGQGVPEVIDASTSGTFTLHSYICAVAADIPAHDQPMALVSRFTGTHCCTAQSIHARCAATRYERSSYAPSTLPLRGGTNSRCTTLY